MGWMWNRVGVGMGEWGMVNGEWVRGMENREWGVGMGEEYRG